MQQPHAFEYEGVTIEFYTATVRTGMEEQRLLARLVEAYQFASANDIDARLWDNFTEYAAAMARSKLTGDVAWYAHSNMELNRIKDAFECFLDEPELLYTRYRLAVTATRIPKKTQTLTPET